MASRSDEGPRPARFEDEEVGTEHPILPQWRLLQTILGQICRIIKNKFNYVRDSVNEDTF